MKKEISKERKPLVLKLIHFFIRVIKFFEGIIIQLFCLPVILFQSVSSCFNSESIESSNYVRIFQIPIRWFFATLFYPFTCFYFGCWFYFTTIILKKELDNVFVMFIVLISSYFSLVFIIFRGFQRKKFIFISLSKILSSQFEVIGFISWILASCLSTRIIPINRMCREKNLKLEKFTKSSIWFLYLSVLDWISIPFLCIVVLTIYRLSYVKQKMKLKGKIVHSIIVSNAIQIVIVDIPVFTLTIPVIFLTIYQFKEFYNKFQKENVEKRFLICLKFLTKIILDIPFFVFALICFFSIIRTYSIIFIVTKYSNRKRKEIWQEFVKLLLDIPSFLSLLIVYSTVYQISNFRVECKKERDVFHFHITAIKFGVCILIESIVFLIFIPPVVILSFWRAKKFFKELKKMSISNQSIITSFSVRIKFYIESFLIFLIDYYFIFQILILTILSLWRIGYIVRNKFKKFNSFEEHRNFCFRQVCFLFPDVLCFLFCVILMLTFYRVQNLIRRYKKEMKKKVYLEFHFIVFDEFFNFLIDLPYIFLALCCGWRILEIIHQIFFTQKREVSENKNISKINRCIVVTQFCCFLLDFPLGLCFILLFVSWYRFPNLVRRLKERKYDSEYSTYFVVFNEFSRFLVDIPFIILSIISLWRVCVIFYKIFLSSKTESSRESSWEDTRFINRRIVLNQFGWFLLDIPFILCLFILIGSIYRLFNLFSRLKNKHKSESAHKIVFTEILQLITDLPFIILSVFTLWRFFYVIYLIKTVRFDNVKEVAKQRRKIVVDQFIITLLEIPFFVSLLFCFISLIHVFTLKKLWNSSHKYAEYRKAVIKLALRIPLDIIPIISSYLVLFTIYRFPFALRMIKILETKRKSTEDLKYFTKRVAMIQGFCVLMDIVGFLSLIIILFTVVRVKEAFSFIFNPRHKWFVNSLSFKESVKIQEKVVELSWYVIVDAPLIAMFLLSFLTVWKVGFLKLIFFDNSIKRIYKYYIFSACTLFTLFADVPLLLGFILLELSLYRRKSRIFTKISSLSAVVNVYKIVFKELLELFVDIVVFFPLMLIICCSIYRLRFVLRFLIKKKWAKGYSFRFFLYNQLVNLVIDSPLIIVSFVYSHSIGFFNVISWYKAVFFIKSDFTRRRMLMNQLMSIPVDTTSCILASMMVVMFWRIPYFFYLVLGKKMKIPRALYETNRKGWNDCVLIIQLLIILSLFDNFICTLKRIFYYIWRIWKKFSVRAFLKKIFRKSNVKGPENGLKICGARQSLCEDMLFEIFCYLPGTKVEEIRLVCKNWDFFIRRNEYLWITITLNYRFIHTRRKISISEWRKRFSKAFPGQHRKEFKKYWLKKNRSLLGKKKIDISSIINEEFRKSLKLAPTMLFFPIKIISFWMFVFYTCVRNIIPESIVRWFTIIRDSNLSQTDLTPVRNNYNSLNNIYNIYKNTLWDNIIAMEFYYKFIFYSFNMFFLYLTIWEPVIMFYSVFALCLFFPLWHVGDNNNFTSRLKKFMLYILSLFGKTWCCLTFILILVEKLIVGIVFPYYFYYEILLIVKSVAMIIFNFIIHPFEIYFIVFNDYMSYRIKMLFFPHFIVNKIYSFVFYLLKKIFDFVFFDFGNENVTWLRGKIFFVLFVFFWCQFQILEALRLYRLFSSKFSSYRPVKYVSDLIKFMYSLLVEKLLIQLIINKIIRGIIFTVIETTVRTVFNLYYNILFKGTVLSKSISVFYIGEVGMIPVTVIWIFWPLSIPYLLKIYSLFIPAILVSSFLLFRGQKIVKIAWESDSVLVKDITFDQMDSVQRVKFEKLKISIFNDEKFSDLTKDEYIRKFLDDKCFFRYLKGKKWSHHAAREQLLKTIRFRYDFRPESLSENKFESLIKRHYFFREGFTNDGQPIIYLLLENEKFTEDSKKNKEKFAYVIFLMENAIKDMSGEVEKVTFVIDVKNSKIGISQVKSVKNTFSSLGDYYTERLGRAVITNMPFSFNLIWRFVQSFLDEVTKRKFIFVSGGKKNFEKEFGKFISKKTLLTRFYGENSKLEKR